MKQGDLQLLDDPVAKDLLDSTTLARLAYTWHDGTARVVPIWFHWTGTEVVMASPPKAPKLGALRNRPSVAITIDRDETPWKVLLIRGKAHIQLVEAIVPEYALAARRYMGGEAADAWLHQLAGMGLSHMARIAVTPAWAAVLDFETRFPSALGL